MAALLASVRVTGFDWYFRADWQVSRIPCQYSVRVGVVCLYRLYRRALECFGHCTAYLSSQAVSGEGVGHSVQTVVNLAGLLFWKQ